MGAAERRALDSIISGASRRPWVLDRVAPAAPEMPSTTTTAELLSTSTTTTTGTPSAVDGNREGPNHPGLDRSWWRSHPDISASVDAAQQAEPSAALRRRIEELDAAHVQEATLLAPRELLATEQRAAARAARRQGEQQ